MIKSSPKNMSEMEKTYRSDISRKIIITVVVMIVATLMAFASIFLSRFSTISPSVAWDVLICHFQGHDYSGYYENLIVWNMYTPRVIMGLTVGAGLAVCGAVMQSLLRNPLAEPYTTGVASGASFGVALYIMMDVTLIPLGSHNSELTVNAILFSLVPTAAIILISKRKSITPTTIILAGIAVMYVFRSATSLMTLYADPDAVAQLYLWNVGSVGAARWDNLWIVLTVTIVGCVLLYVFARQVTIMTTGDNNARSMGVKTKIVRTTCLILIAAVTAVIVGYCGTIGFMGLVAPHVARMIVGSNLRYMLPCSAACGALILVVCDLIAKMVSDVFYAGVITSIIGGPVFIILLIKGAKKVWY